MRTSQKYKPNTIDRLVDLLMNEERKTFHTEGRTQHTFKGEWSAPHYDLESAIAEMASSRKKQLAPRRNVRKEIADAIEASDFKDIWDNADRDACFELVNEIRIACGAEPYSRRKFEEGWQYRTVFHEDFTIAKNELLNLVFGWW